MATPPSLLLEKCLRAINILLLSNPKMNNEYSGLLLEVLKIPFSMGGGLGY